jgi:hypothetical protein
MALTFADLQTEVSRRATKDQSGTQFTSAIKTIINSSLFRIARETCWRPLRRKAIFNTVTDYTSTKFTISGSVSVSPTTGAIYKDVNNYFWTVQSYSAPLLYASNNTSSPNNTGTGTLTKISGTGDATLTYTAQVGTATTTNNSNTVTIAGGTLITDGVIIRRKIKFQSSGTYYFINQITAEGTIVLDQVYKGAGSTTDAYDIMPQEEYVLPPQVSHRMWMWHEAYGYPFVMNYVTDQTFYKHGLYLTIKYIPTHYRMWIENDVISQPLQPGILQISSSSTADTNIPITVFGTVSGYPDYEIITTNASDGTTAVNGAKMFQNIERVSKGSPTVGRVTITSDSAANIVAVMPVGDTTATIQYRKVQFYPLPNGVYPITVQYYKDPWRLVNDNDIHDLGQEFDEAIILLSVAKIKGESNMAESDRFMAWYRDEINSLKRTNVDKIDWDAMLRKPRQLTNDPLLMPNLFYRQAGPGFGPSTSW